MTQFMKRSVNDLIIRPLRWPDDSRPILKIDTRFETHSVYDVLVQTDGFQLQERKLAEPLSKRYELDDELDTLPAFEQVLVVESAGKLVGLAGFKLERWNRRANLVHFYLDAECRGLGIGRALMQATLQAARNSGMRALWLETQNVNFAAIQFYRRMGFRLCGLDTSLYDPQLIPGEIALYFAYVFTEAEHVLE